MKKQDLKNFIWNTIGVSINSFISLFYLIVVTRINGIELSGVFSYCYSFSMIMYVISNLGGRTFQLTDNEKFDDNYYFSIRIYTSIVAIGFSILYCILLNYDILKSFILLSFVLVRVIESFSDTIYCVFQRNNRLDYVGISLVLKNFICLLIFFIIDVLTKNIIISIFSILISTIFIYVLYDKKILKRFKQLKLKFDNRIAIQLFNNTKYFFFFNFLTMLITNCPKILVDMLYDDKLQGYFGIIIMIPSIMGLFGLLIIQPVILELTNLYNSKEIRKLNQKIIKIFLLILAIAVVCIICALLLGVPVFKLLYNIDFSDYKIYLAISVLAGMFNVYTSFSSTLLTIIKKTKVQFYLYILILLFEVIAILFCSSLIGFKGIFIGYTITSFINYICFYLYFLKNIQKERE